MQQTTDQIPSCDSREWMRTYIENKLLQEGRQLSAYLHNYGCQQNVADGETLEGIVLELGYTLAQSPETADLVIYNTCAVRENAENRVFGNIGALRQAKLQNPEMVVALCGCMVQQQHIMEQVKKSYSQVDILFGAGVMHTLPDLLYHHFTENRRIFSVEDPTVDIIEGLPVHRRNSFQASVPIMTGCDNFCSYCIVPHVRGRERSREFAAVVEEIQQLLEQGYKEITLLGQNVNSYGKGLPGNPTFPQLLEKIAQLPYKFRLRFMTSHPKDATQELLNVMASYETISKHLHLPVQSGSDEILKQMNRKYTVDHYLSLVDYAKQIMPECTITSDLIVGFPGETAEDFEKTLDLVKRVGYSGLFTFAYSPRKGTPAEKLPQTLTQQEKTERFQRLLALQRQQGNRYHESLMGQTVEVLVEGPSSNQEGFLQGRTDGNVIVLFQGDLSLVGEFCPIHITNYYDWALEGSVTK